MTDEQHHDDISLEDPARDTPVELSNSEDTLISGTDGLGVMGGAASIESAHNEQMVSLAHKAQADEAAAERWDEPAQPAAPVHLSKDDAALNDLNAAIDAHPEAASNYVFRGELLLKHRAYAAAEADFQHALDMASDEVIKSRWGIRAQTVQDRAYAGLRDARHKQGL